MRRLLQGETSHQHNDTGSVPLPFILVFAGYSFILLVDRVMFDSHVLFKQKDHEDEVEEEEESPVRSLSPTFASSEL